MSKDLLLIHDPAIMIMMSVKFQMVLPEDLATRMKAKAASKKIPLAQYVRDTISRDLASSEEQTPNFLQRIRGRFTEVQETDIAARVDEILYGGAPHS